MRKETYPMARVYGPVPSRRLGYSLGIDILPFKTCTLDCVYCQLGSTGKTTVERGIFFDQDELLVRIREAVQSSPRIDFITFSGSGEPTLDSRIGSMIREIKAFTPIPVAVLTNGTLLSRPEVREALREADLVVPSLDAVTQAVFIRVNRPHPSLRVEDLVAGIRDFRREFSGRLWLEVMLVKGINDHSAHIRRLKEVIEDVGPDRVHLNTVVRPPAEKTARALGPEEMESIRRRIGPLAEVVAEFRAAPPSEAACRPAAAIREIVRRRPVTARDISESLGLPEEEVRVMLEDLVRMGGIRIVKHQGRIYYESCGGETRTGGGGRKRGSE